MEDIVFVHTPDCRNVQEMNASKKKKTIIKSENSLKCKFAHDYRQRMRSDET